jgi:hypothetical protein
LPPGNIGSRPTEEFARFTGLGAVSALAASQRSRVSVSLWLLLLIALGLGSRRVRGLPGWVMLYAGDVAYGALFFALSCVLRPRLTTVRAWLAALMTTELIELSQLYHAPWLDALRATRAGGLLLGHVFLWSDVVCVALGASLAAGAELAWKNFCPSH